MARNSLKKYLPTSLLGRAILILLFPIVLVEIIVGIAFIQRHFEQVTDQMSEGISLEIIFMKNELEKKIKSGVNPNDLKQMIYELGNEFGYTAKYDHNLELNLIDDVNFFDVSGKTFVNNLNEKLGSISAFDLTNPRIVNIQTSVSSGRLDLMISRKRISASNPHQLLVLMILVTILLVLFSFIILKNQIRPIGKLAKAAEAFGKGQFVEFKPGGSDEVRRAGVAFLAMRARIERQIKQRTQMLSGVSHDLRTPLTRLKLALALQKESQEVRDMLDDVDSMGAMLDEFLEFSKVSKKEVTKEILVVDFLGRLVKKNQRHFDNIHLEIISPLKKEFTIEVRENALSRGIQNIIDNAMTFGDKVNVIARKDTNYIVLQIEDNGPGIHEDNYELALRPFSRLDEARNQNSHSGVGLGLSISTDIVRNHGGKVSLYRSEKLGGLGVSIRIPI
ncbi:MAG: ATP-binding protein [Paracoccaceae bacterium]|nr:ATP-binding protein [Paracoccaceae bacterium]